MNPEQFNTLSEHKSLRKLLIDGTCIGERNTDELQVLLFQLHNFYVEVFLNMACNEVTETRRFDNSRELQPYFESTTISNRL